ncbi:MAG: FAD-binding oxidoreductase [Cyanobacteria bacterium J06641_5]
MPSRDRERLTAVDLLRLQLQTSTTTPPAVVMEADKPLGTVDFDAIVCGGTLGIVLAAALQQRGWRIAVLERGILRGRDQEWNISRHELRVFLELELLSPAELEAAIATEYNPARVAFAGGPELWVRDILNLGVDPVRLLATLKTKFLAAGGKLLEEAPFTGASVRPDGIVVTARSAAGAGGERRDPLTLSARLLIDAMGNFSPIVRQARKGARPDGLCLVVGSCAQGHSACDTGDLLVTLGPATNGYQPFWEAFPARDGRTTYLFTYIDAASDLTLEDLWTDYEQTLPGYQGIELAELTLQRSLFGFFPSYRQSPLRVPWNRVLPIGDSSGAQSPVSFGGFGFLVRHLERLTLGVEAALQADALQQQDLALLQPYQPNIAVTWLFQQAMRVPPDRAADFPGDRINALLGSVFAAMERLGDDALRPFLQDVVRFPALTQTLLLTAVLHPNRVVPVVPQVGVPALLDWTKHFLQLGLYHGLAGWEQPIMALGDRLPPQQRYVLQRWRDAWLYGAGVK